VDQFRRQFFARASLARDENVAIRSGDPGDLTPHLLHAGTVPHHSFAVKQAEQRGVLDFWNVRLRQASCDGGNQFLLQDRFPQIIADSAGPRSRCQIGSFPSLYQDHRGISALTKPRHHSRQMLLPAANSHQNHRAAPGGCLEDIPLTLKPPHSELVALKGYDPFDRTVGLDEERH
jgi:hypothetical protein